MGAGGGDSSSILDSGLLQGADDTSLPSAPSFGPTALGSSGGLGALGQSSGYGPTSLGSSAGLGSLGASSLPSAAQTGSGSNVLGTLQGLTGLANSGLSIYGALNQQRQLGSILGGGPSNNLSPQNGASIAGGGEKLGSGASSPLSIANPEISQSGLPNNRHFQVLLNLLGVKQG